MARLGPDRLADLPADGIRFFSDRPNAAETALPACDDLIAAYTTAQEAYVAAIGTSAPIAAPAKLTLRATETGATVDLYDAHGKHLDYGWMNHDMEPFDRSPAPPVSPPAAWADLDAPTRQMLSVIYAPVTSPLADPPEAYLHPERFDPLGFSVRTGLLALPRRPGAPTLVVAMSDDLLRWADRCTKDGRIDPGAFAVRLNQKANYETTTHDGATIVRPRDALQSEMALVDREALGRGIRRVVADGGPSLNNLPPLHLAIYSGYGQPAADLYLKRLLYYGTPKERIPSNVPWGVWTMLGAAQATDATEVDADTPPFANLVRNGVLLGWLAFEGPPGASDLDRYPSTLLARLGRARVAPWRSEIPVADKYGNRPEYDTGARRDPGSFTGLDAETLGFQATVMSTTVPPQYRFGDWKGDAIQKGLRDMHYRLGHRTSIGVDVRLANGQRGRVEASGTGLDRFGLAFSDLPPEFQATALRAAQNVLDNPPPISHDTGTPSIQQP